MDAEISPDPTDDEREAMLAALEPTRSDRSVAEDSPWRRAALEEAVEGLDA